jgi:hypothetical protein
MRNNSTCFHEVIGLRNQEGYVDTTPYHAINRFYGWDPEDVKEGDIITLDFLNKYGYAVCVKRFEHHILWCGLFKKPRKDATFKLDEFKRCPYLVTNQVGNARPWQINEKVGWLKPETLKAIKAKLASYFTEEETDE